MSEKKHESQAARCKIFAVNINVGGKLHRLLPTAMELYHDKRTACGWRVGSAVAKARFCSDKPTMKLCRKCFPDKDQYQTREIIDDAIEEVD